MYTVSRKQNVKIKISLWKSLKRRGTLLTFSLATRQDTVGSVLSTRRSHSLSLRVSVSQSYTHYAINWNQLDLTCLFNIEFYFMHTCKLAVPMVTLVQVQYFSRDGFFTG